MAGSAFFFSLMALFVKLAGQAGVPSMQIVFARCAVMLVLTYAMLWQAGVTSRGVDRRNLFLRGFTGFTALSIFYFALTKIPLGDAATIYNTAPIHTALLAGLFLRERVRGVVVVAIVLSLVGGTLIAKPAFVFVIISASYPSWIVYAALGGAFLSGAAYTFVRKLKDTDHALVVILWFSWVGALGALPFAFVDAHFPDTEGDHRRRHEQEHERKAAHRLPEQGGLQTPRWVTRGGFPTATRRHDAPVATEGTRGYRSARRTGRFPNVRIGNHAHGLACLPPP